MMKLRSKFLAQAEVGCTTPVAVSVAGKGHHTAGQDVLLAYPTTITNVGGAWHGNAQFAAPCKGIYYFNITFVKDSYSEGGTTDDVRVYLAKNGQYIGSAWSGEGDGRRGTGAYGVTLNLKGGDLVTTWVNSDGGPMRHLAEYNFSALLLRP